MRQVFLDRLGGDPVSQGADLEFVGTEQVSVVGAGEVGGQFGDFGIAGLADGLSEALDLGLLLGAQRRGWHGRTPVPGSDSPQRSPISLLCTKIPPTFKTPTVDRPRGEEIE